MPARQRRPHGSQESIVEVSGGRHATEQLQSRPAAEISRGYPNQASESISGSSPAHSVPVSVPAESLSSPDLVEQHTNSDQNNNGMMINRLHKASVVGDLGAISRFIKDGGDLEAQSFCGRTALHYAAFYGHADVARALVLAGANVCSRGGGNSTVRTRVQYQKQGKTLDFT
ncbi:unnamed protein product [Choristocarpus tenellus]